MENQSPSDASEPLWAERYEALLQFTKRENHALVPVNHTETLHGTEMKLGAWVSYLRKRYHEKQLDEKWVQRLEKLDGWAWGPLRPGPKNAPSRDRQILQLRKKGLSLQAIANEFGLSRQRVHQIVRKNG